MKEVRYATNISWQFMDEEVYIVNERNQKVYVLDNSAKDFWLAINRHGFAEIIQDLCDQYCLEKQIIKKDFCDFIEKLNNLELVEVI